MSFETEIERIYCNEMLVWHPRDIFVCLFIEPGGKHINLWAKLKLFTQNFKQHVGQHSFCVVIEDIFSAIVFSTPGMWLEEIQISLFCANFIHVLQYHYKEQNACLPYSQCMLMQYCYQLRYGHV